jgi:ribosomal protein S18 acetylase RimI-like enzyme
MHASIHILGPGDAELLARAAPDVFDGPVDPALAAEFLADPRHHIAVAVDGDAVVGFASGVHYVHPDKPAQLFVNEVGVAPTHQRRGIALRLLEALFAEGRAAGCAQAWVGTDVSNDAARRLYAAAGGVEAPEPFVMVEFGLDDGPRPGDPRFGAGG